MVAVLDADECCPTIGEAPLSEADAAELARGFAALADTARLRVLSLLASAEKPARCAPATSSSRSAAPSPPSRTTSRCCPKPA